MIADYLKDCAWWRLNRAEADDGGRNARAALALLDAAAYVRGLDDGERHIQRLHAVGRFAHGRYDPGPKGELLIRFWHYRTIDGDPEELLGRLADAAEHSLIPAQRVAR